MKIKKRVVLPKTSDVVVEEMNEDLGSKPLCRTLQDLSLGDEVQMIAAVNDTGITLLDVIFNNSNK